MKRFERQCHNCGLTDSIDPKDQATSQLVEAVGPTDGGEFMNLQLYFVYCRKCKHMSVFNPGWLGGRKFIFRLTPDQIEFQYRTYAGLARMQDAVGVPRHVQDALLDRMEEVLRHDGFNVDTTRHAKWRDRG